MDALTKRACELRRDITEMVYSSRAEHVGGDLSVTDILTVPYLKIMDVPSEKGENLNHDRFPLSRGHCADALYYALGEKGFYGEEETTKTFSQFGSRLVGHSNMEVPEVEMNSGPLGHGISVGVSMALAARMNHQSYRTYVVLGDGEMTEGSNYEGMMVTGHCKLDNLCVTMDLNRLQISGTTGQVVGSASLVNKFRDFGRNVIEALNENDCAQLVNTYKQTAVYKGKPTVVITNTVKGKGVSFMKNQISRHHGVITEEQYEQAVEELKEALQ